MATSLDPQIYPSTTLAAPKECPNGCARWSNLAEDGNTQNQQEANSKWAQGQAPPGASSDCARPSNDPLTGPWCYCAGTNDNSRGVCVNKDATSQTCKSIPNKLSSINSDIANCTSPVETAQISSLGQKTINLQKDVNHLSAVVQDTLLMGDAIYGKASHALIVEQVKERNTELKEKKDKLMTDIKKKEAVVERSDRDFIEVKDKLPEKFNMKRLNFVEDYTIAITMIGYLFMVIAIIYVYTISRQDGHILRGLLMSTTGIVILSLFLYSIFILLA